MSGYYFIATSQSLFSEILSNLLETKYHLQPLETINQIDSNLCFLYLPFTKIPWNYVLTNHICVNHHLMRSSLVRKNELYEMLLKHHCNFVPETICFTGKQMKKEILQFVHSFSNDLFILKPSNESNARGIMIFKRDHVNSLIERLESSSTVWCLQKYIESPLLIEGSKFHIRAVMLICGTDYFLYSNFICLLSAKKYSQAINENVTNNTDDFSIHVTNFSVQSTSDADNYQGNQRLNASELQSKIGNDSFRSVYSQMKSIAIQTLQVAERNSKKFLPLSFCFELFGVDFIVDDRLKVWLLEINANGGFGHHQGKHELFTEILATDMMEHISKLDSFGANNGKEYINPNNLFEKIGSYNKIQ